MNAEDMNDVSHDHTSDVGWGTPTPPTPQRPAASTGWSALRRALLWSVLVLGVPGIGLGLFVIAEDLAETTDMWHGFGIAIGTVLAVPCLALCVLAGFGLRSMRRHGPTGGRTQAVTIGLLLVLVLLLVGLTPFLLLPVVLGAGLLLSVFADTDARA